MPSNAQIIPESEKHEKLFVVRMLTSEFRKINLL